MSSFHHAHAALRRLPLLALAAFLVIAGSLPPDLRAQDIHMKDGQTIISSGLKRDGDAVVAKIQTAAGTAGEVGYQVVNIARIDFPEPGQLKIAGDLLNAGKSDEALRQLTPIVAYYAPFRDVPGNWWLPLAFLQEDAFARLGRDREADGLVNEITHVAGVGPDILRGIKIRQAASLERKGEHRKALDLLDPVIKDPTAPLDALSEGWLTVGSARLALHDYRDALLAFLHVSLYTPDKALLMPPALFGAASAYAALDDKPHAKATFDALIASYPTAPEAAPAKDRLRRLGTVAATPTPAGG